MAAAGRQFEWLGVEYEVFVMVMFVYSIGWMWLSKACFILLWVMMMTEETSSYITVLLIGGM